MDNPHNYGYPRSSILLSHIIPYYSKSLTIINHY